MAPFISDYRINVIELAWMTQEEIHRRFHGDFRIFVNHLAQRRQQQNYVPDRQAIRHVRAVVELLSVMEQDRRFENAYNKMVQENITVEKGVWTMCDLLDKIENQGFEKGAQMEREQNARGMRDIGMTLEQIATVLRTDVPAVTKMLQN